MRAHPTLNATNNINDNNNENNNNIINGVDNVNPGEKNSEENTEETNPTRSQLRKRAHAQYCKTEEKMPIRSHFSNKYGRAVAILEYQGINESYVPDQDYKYQRGPAGSKREYLNISLGRTDGTVRAQTVSDCFKAYNTVYTVKHPFSSQFFTQRGAQTSVIY
jgi:hypothetical protein